MREIKFRAWWSDPGIMKDFSLGQDYLRGYKHGEKWCLELDDADSIMQYTGLKDKNGTEIYEGDILNTPGYVGLVKYYKCSYLCGGYRLFQLGLYEDDIEVIGNIHENPELLDNH